MMPRNRMSRHTVIVPWSSQCSCLFEMFHPLGQSLSIWPDFIKLKTLLLPAKEWLKSGGDEGERLGVLAVELQDPTYITTTGSRLAGKWKLKIRAVMRWKDNNGVSKSKERGFTLTCVGCSDLERLLSELTITHLWMNTAPWCYNWDDWMDNN